MKQILKLTLGWLLIIPLLILLGFGWILHYTAKTLINDKVLGYMLATLIKTIEIKNTKL